MTQREADLGVSGVPQVSLLGTFYLRSVMKRLLMFATLAAAVAAVVKKLQDQEAERDLWAEATDGVTTEPPTGN